MINKLYEYEKLPREERNKIGWEGWYNNCYGNRGRGDTEETGNREEHQGDLFFLLFTLHSFMIWK